MTADEEEKARREAYRTEYGVVANTWQSFQRERLLLAGTLLTTGAILAGAFVAGVRVLGTLDEGRSMAVFVPLVPLLGGILTAFVWLTDVWLQWAQQIARQRAAELEILLGLQNGFFTQMHVWQMPRIFSFSPRTIIGIALLAVCALGYLYVYPTRTRTETIIPRQDIRGDLEKSRACNCNCSCVYPFTPRPFQGTVPDRKE